MMFPSMTCASSEAQRDSWTLNRRRKTMIDCIYLDCLNVFVILFAIAVQMLWVRI